MNVLRTTYVLPYSTSDAEVGPVKPCHVGILIALAEYYHHHCEYSYSVEVNFICQHHHHYHNEYSYRPSHTRVRLSHDLKIGRSDSIFSPIGSI